MKQAWHGILLTMVIMISLTPVGMAKDKAVGMNDFERLLTWMTGSFSSAEQAKADSTIGDIRIEMVSIWKHRSDAYWIYVEQAAAEAMDEPFRQRVYRLSQVNDTLFKTDIYSFAEPLRFAGDWKKPIPLEKLTVDSLNLVDGCSLFFKRSGDTAFVGSTLGKGCLSSMGGAKYATSEVKITATGMTMWDRGFTAADKQVWGAGASSRGYIFKKQ